MKFPAAALLLLATPLVQAADPACLAVEEDLLINITDGRGCDSTADWRFCERFSRCLREHRLCVSDRQRHVFADDRLEGFRLSAAASAVAISRVTAAGAREYCVLAAPAVTPGQPLPHWAYRIYNASGDPVGDDLVELFGGYGVAEVLHRSAQLVHDQDHEDPD